MIRGHPSDRGLGWSRVAVGGSMSESAGRAAEQSRCGVRDDHDQIGGPGMGLAAFSHHHRADSRAVVFHEAQLHSKVLALCDVMRSVRDGCVGMSPGPLFSSYAGSWYRYLKVQVLSGSEVHTFSVSYAKRTHLLAWLLPKRKIRGF